MRFKDWATREIETTELIRRIKTFIVREKNDCNNLAHRYRMTIYRELENEKRLISG